MTKEEAAEVILGGDPFERCAVCNGMGFTHLGLNSESCTVCLQEADTGTGSGKVLKPRYAEAYAIAGVTPPHAKWSP